MQKVKTQNLSRLKTEDECFYQTVQFRIVNNHDLSKNKKLVDF